MLKELFDVCRLQLLAKTNPEKKIIQKVIIFNIYLIINIIEVPGGTLSPLILKLSPSDAPEESYK